MFYEVFINKQYNMNTSYSKIRHIHESNIILEQRRNKTYLNESTVTQVMWTSCGNDNTELTPESKKKLEMGDKVGDKQYYYFSSEPQDTVGEYKIMDCLGPEIGKKNDLEILNYSGKNYLSKNYN